MDFLSALPHFELKYCEHCAGLWLRPEGSTTPYCPACEPFMARLPRRRLRRPRPPVRRFFVPAVVSLLVLLANRPEQALFGWWA